MVKFSKYPLKGTKEYDDLVIQKAKELKIAIETEIIRQSISALKSYKKWAKEKYG